MPIGPYTDGIYTDAAFAAVSVPAPMPAPAPVPTGVGTAASGTNMNGTAVSGTSVTSNGSLVSYFPPVTDWFSPLDQTPATQMPAMQTPASHPCQSGGDCGCGGTCKNKQQSQVASSPEKKSYRDLSKNPLSASEVEELDKQFGTTFIAGNPSSNGTIITVDPIDNNLLVRIRKIADASILYENTFQKEPNGWSIGGSSIEGNFPKISFGIAAFIGLLAQQMTASKLGMELSFNVETGSFKAEPKVQSDPNMAAMGTGYSILQTQTPCIQYDLVCTMPFIEADGKHLSLWMLPIGNFQVDIGSCCHTHDIAWWCANNYQDVYNANSAVVECIGQAILDAAYGACSNDLSCGGIFYLACEAAVAVCDALATVFVAGYEAATFIGGPAGTFFFALEQQTGLFNFDGSHSNSCLCGGTGVTYQCPGFIDDVDGNPIYGNPCRNVCLEVGSNIGAQPGCFNCYWDCQYDSSGNLLPTSPVVNNGQTCCTGSAGTVSPYDGSQCDSLSQSCAATDCASCSWKCIYYRGGAEYWTLEKSNSNLPCCGGTPPMPDSRCSNDRFGGMGGG